MRFRIIGETRNESTQRIRYNRVNSSRRLQLSNVAATNGRKRRRSHFVSVSVQTEKELKRTFLFLIRQLRNNVELLGTDPLTSLNDFLAHTVERYDICFQRDSELFFANLEIKLLVPKYKIKIK